ncbi:MAG TPA: hypothetical protein PLP17_05690 [Oligoflexia bacterium]|nr:hypothetical protein [Oligoflexia bacterium]
MDSAKSLNEKLALVYPYAALVLTVLWLVWLLVPDAVLLRLTEVAPNNFTAWAVRLTGFTVLNAFFLFLGVFGLLLCWKGFVWYDLAISVFFAPFIQAAGIMAEKPYNVAVHIVSLAFVVFFAGLAIWRFRSL